MGNLYPVGYGMEMVSFETLKSRYTPHMHPEAARRGFNFILSQKGLFGIGGGYRPPGLQPGSKTGFAPPGHSFHEGQQFPSGLYYVAWDMVCASPGRPHRTPKWSEVPAQGTQFAKDYGWHMNVSTEPWHAQPIELDGWTNWNASGKPDLQMNYPIKDAQPKPPIENPQPVPPLPQEEHEMLYLAELSDGTVVVVGSAIRPVSGHEIEPGGPYVNLPRYKPDPESNWHYWMRKGCDEYVRRVISE